MVGIGTHVWVYHPYTGDYARGQIVSTIPVQSHRTNSLEYGIEFEDVGLTKRYAHREIILTDDEYAAHLLTS